MRRKNFENIGKVAVNEITLCDTEIGLYIPIEKMYENIRREDENEIHVEFYDPFEIEINAEDNKYLKKLVMNKLMEAFF